MLHFSSITLFLAVSFVLFILNKISCKTKLQGKELFLFAKSPESCDLKTASGARRNGAGVSNNGLNSEQNINPTKYNLSFFEAITVCYKKYFTCRCRAGRSEFWYFTLFCSLISFVLSVIEIYFYSRNVIKICELVFLYGNLIPSINVKTRRLHDVGKSGWWQLIEFTGIGILVTLFFYIKASASYPNKYD